MQTDRPSIIARGVVDIPPAVDAGPNTADVGAPLADAGAAGQDDTPLGDALGGVTSRAHTERSALAAEICARVVTE